jgi:hypothetical protein
MRGRTIQNFLISMALALSLGAQWQLLQSVAWVHMFIGFSQAGTVQEALAKTFDGRHPCKLCKMVETGKKAEKREQAAKLKEKKFDAVFASTIAPELFPPSLERLVFSGSCQHLDRPNPPSLPPPKFA